MKIKMKPVHVIGGCLILLLGVFAACSKDNSDEGKQESMSKASQTLESYITVTRSTNLTTEEFFKMGVRSITVQQTNDGTVYTFDAFNSFEAHGISFSYGVKSYILKDGAISESHNPDTALTVRDGEVYIRTGNVEKKLSEMPDFGQDLNVATLVSLVNELCTNASEKDTYANHARAMSSIACSAGHLAYVYGWGMTPTAAEADLESETADSDYANDRRCRKLNTSPYIAHHEVAVGFFDLHLGFITATDTYCCTYLTKS